MMSNFRSRLSNQQISLLAGHSSTVKAQQRRKQCLKVASQLIKEHLSTLAFKYRQSITHDDYGNTALNIRKWERQREVFMLSVLRDEIGDGWLTGLHVELCNLIDVAAAAAQERVGRDLREMSPYEFEEHCANVLRSAGWSASATKRSGDQGIDVIAKKKKIVVALQCKLYSSAIGNTAVQEAIAGREFLRATFAAVVTNSSYTKSARQLAENTGVLLLHINDLASLEARVTAFASCNTESD